MRWVPVLVVSGCGYGANAPIGPHVPDLERLCILQTEYDVQVPVAAELTAVEGTWALSTPLLDEQVPVDGLSAQTVTFGSVGWSRGWNRIYFVDNEPESCPDVDYERFERTAHAEVFLDGAPRVVTIEASYDRQHDDAAVFSVAWELDAGDTEGWIPALDTALDERFQSSVEADPSLPFTMRVTGSFEAATIAYGIGFSALLTEGDYQGHRAASLSGVGTRPE